jgi:uncharacterized protein YdaU (DUF1376 family)
MNFFKFHLGDYYKKASHLSMLEDGAYRRLIDAVYLREGPLPADREQIFRLVKAFTKLEKDAVLSVLGEFFTLTDAGYTNARCEQELARVRDKSEKASQSASTRWGNANAPPDAMRTHSEGNASHKPVAKSSSTARARSPATGQHRAMALDLLDRGKADLSPWERNFLEDLCGKSTITPKIEERLAEIGRKIGFNADELMATWKKRLDVARKLSQWDVKWGPMPGKLGCLVPEQLIQPGDGDGWTEWRAAS